MLPRHVAVTIVLAGCVPKQVQPPRPSVACEQCKTATALAVGMPIRVELAWSAVCRERHLYWDSHDDGSTQDIGWRHDEVPCNGEAFTYQIDCDNCQAGETRHTADQETAILSVTPSSEGPFQVGIEMRAGGKRFAWRGPIMTATLAKLELWCTTGGEPLAPCDDRPLDPSDTYFAVAASSSVGPRFLTTTDQVDVVGLPVTWKPIPDDPEHRMGMKVAGEVPSGTRAVGLTWRNVRTAASVTFATE